MRTKVKTQRQWIKDKLLEEGEISRNFCLGKYISRLSGHIYAIKEANPHWEIEAKAKKTKHGEDYIYTLVNQIKIRKQILSA
ncbi:hypothetical protein YY92_08305 [Campylobacter fetus]|uniref:hypothetical protein n=1 Tax=Campylobacter fetus TaxID=196 RepID=UPI0011C712C7|nr:hypothetical protein [Campylobacter fetus]EAJ1232610.1 hypothetical protein [Campylobacter fetus]EAK0414711.1 hypothetical protein [Campylobacter fetus]TXF09173.1 hypothetical protein FPD25_03300 [Campylobacter fetus subsp. fetus]